jgi:hypothetical protein
MTGSDVDGWARAAHRYLHDGQLSAYEKQPDIMRNTFGTGKRTLAKQCAAKAGLPQYGIVGPNLEQAMRDHGAFDSLADNLIAQYNATVAKPTDRQRVINAARFYLENARHIAYSQMRPIITVYRGITPPDIPHALDCSGLAITCYYVAGVIDKLGWQNAKGYGNTWTLAAEGRPIRSSDLQPGDLVFYGACSHVSVYEGGGKVISNGHYPMSREPLMYRTDYFGSRSYLP